MALSKESYQALEDIVGSENISEEPALLDSYAYQWLTETVRMDQDHWNPRAEAVLMPGSSNEVQAVMRMCNRYGIKCKCHSTGWGFFGTANVENCILLDLRRMNRILEINEQNMFVVVEPAVINAQLQAELMKRGLNNHMIGAGASCSPLATCTSFGGMGPDSVFFGHSSQNMLAVEWVMPSGDIVRTGSWGSGAGCFCGEGPGPSVRSIIRGERGAAGGMGIFTKCAIKVSPWPGPPQAPIEGTVPAYNMPLRENIRAHTIAFPTWEAYAKAYRKISEAEIAYIAHRQFNQWGEALWPAVLRLFTDPTKSLDDLEELLEMPEIQKLVEDGKRSFQIVLAGNSPRDFEYKEKVLDEILAELGGNKVAAMEEPAESDLSLLWMIKLPFKAANMILAGNYFDAIAPYGTPEFIAVKVTESAVEEKRPFLGKGIVDDGGDAFMGGLASLGGANISGWELFCFYDPSDADSVKAANDITDRMRAVSDERGWGPGHGRMLGATGLSMEEIQRILSEGKHPGPDFHRWQGKIKQAIDPNNIGDFGYYYLEERKK